MLESEEAIAFAQLHENCMIEKSPLDQGAGGLRAHDEWKGSISAVSVM